ncbi:MAG: GTP 3',8-cyclase MoaA [Gemmatimonadetes bacterium]|nr:GTP 3',8-cyclase MoaA [Gemmatimonadota bacterium]
MALGRTAPNGVPRAASDVRDAFGRPVRSLRISVTDKCNLRCGYCMPEEDYVWLGRQEILSFEEIAVLAGAFSDLGVDRLRITGGEPLLRRELEVLVGSLAADPRVRDLALTTNGVLLPRLAGRLREAGLGRVTVSLDTLRPERFLALTRRDAHAEVLRGIGAARDAGFERLKLNTVVIRGFNDDELGDLLEFGRRAGAEVRFIEYMDVGGATRWALDRVVSRAEILRVLEERYGAAVALPNEGSAPADRFVLPDGLTFGIVSSTTAPFCGTCDRARLTTDGMFFLCLYARDGLDLKRLLRGGAGAGEIRDAIAGAWRARTDRGAEDRLALGAPGRPGERGVLYAIEDLRRDVHREMHTRGG